MTTRLVKQEVGPTWLGRWVSMLFDDEGGTKLRVVAAYVPGAPYARQSNAKSSSTSGTVYNQQQEYFEAHPKQENSGMDALGRFAFGISAISSKSARIEEKRPP
jgi:hypothetical protein